MESHYICPFRYRLVLCIKEFTKNAQTLTTQKSHLKVNLSLSHTYIGLPSVLYGSPSGNASFRGIFLLRPVWLPRVFIFLYSLSLAEIIRPKGTREREEVCNTSKWLDSNNEPFKTQVKMNDQHFQIPIRSGTHGHVSTSSYELLSDPLVNKLQFFLFFTIFHCSGEGAQNVIRKCSYCQENSNNHFCFYLLLYTFSPCFVGT